MTLIWTVAIFGVVILIFWKVVLAEDDPNDERYREKIRMRLQKFSDLDTQRAEDLEERRGARIESEPAREEEDLEERRRARIESEPAREEEDLEERRRARIERERSWADKLSNERKRTRIEREGNWGEKDEREYARIKRAKDKRLRIERERVDGAAELEKKRTREAEELAREAEELEERRVAEDLDEARAIMKNKLVGEWHVQIAGILTQELILIPDHSFVWTNGIDREVRSGRYEIGFPIGVLPKFSGKVRRQADQVGQCDIKLVDRHGVEVVVGAKLIPGNKLLLSLPDKEELFTKK